jgi:hypothetical protein
MAIRGVQRHPRACRPGGWRVSEGPKWSVSFKIQAEWKWLPSTELDTESNFIFWQADWFCFNVLAAWRKGDGA